MYSMGLTIWMKRDTLALYYPPKERMDGMDQIALAQMIADKAPHLGFNLEILKKVSKGVRASLFNDLALEALHDPRIEFTAAERTAILDAMNRRWEHRPQAMHLTMHFKVSIPVKQAIKARAKQLGQTPSQYIRGLITLDMAVHVPGDELPTTTPLDKS